MSTLNELLTTLKRDILHDRSDQVAGDNDQLWSDATLISYINQAQRRFSRRSLCVRDGSSAMSRIVSVPFQKEYPLDPSVIAVMSCRDVGNGIFIDGIFTPGAVDWLVDPPTVVFNPALVPIEPFAGDLARGSHSIFDGTAALSTQPFDINHLGRQSPGRPLAYATDEFTSADQLGSVGVVNLRLYPLPSVAYSGITYQLRVCRTAKKLVGLGDTPEIPEDYHDALLEYAAYMALRIVDHELGDPVRAGEFLTSFEARVVECRMDMLRKQFQPLTWGFGRGGFGYAGN